MTLPELIAQKGGQAEVAKALGVNKSYISRAVSGGLKPGLAVRIYRKWGIKLGPIADATPKQIDAIESLSMRPERKSAAA
jgi:hypothetical protein